MSENFLTLPGVTYLGVTRTFTLGGKLLIAAAVISFIVFVGCVIASIKLEEEALAIPIMLSLLALVAIMAIIAASVRPVLYTDIRVDGSSESARWILDNCEVRQVEGTKWSVRYTPPQEIEYTDIKLRIYTNGKVETR